MDASSVLNQGWDPLSLSILHITPRHVWSACGTTDAVLCLFQNIWHHSISELSKITSGETEKLLLKDYITALIFIYKT